ncbi:MAG: cell division FtsA domain-containing protein [Candidatus Nanosyncoccus sp.]
MHETKQAMTTAHKIKPENILLALDIGTEFVKAVIAEKTNDDNLNIIGVGKEHQNMGNMYAGAIADIQAVVSTCEKALSRAEEMAGVVSKTCVVGIAGELIKGNTRTVRYRRKDSNKPITDNEMQQIIQKVQEKAGEQAKQEIALETDNPEVEVRLINSAIVSLSIDGYKVSNPIGFKGSDLMIQFYTAFAPLVHISAIEKVCAELNLDLLAVAVEPFAVCRACLGNELESNFSAIVMDIGGGTTDIAVVDDGGVEGTKMFGIGGRSFTHQIASRTGLDYDTAEAVKLQIGGVSLDQLTLMHRDETVAEAERRNEIQTILSTPERAKKINEAISDNIEVWLGGVAVALEDFPLIEALPTRILLCGGGAGLSALQEKLAISDWYNDLPFSRRPLVHLLDDVDIPGIENSTSENLDYSLITAFGLLRVAIDTLAGTDEPTGLRAKLAKLLQN